MRTASILLVLTLATASASAQGVNTSIIKDRAREVTGQKPNPPPQRPAAAPAASPAAAAQARAQAAQQQSMRKLVTDLAILKSRSEATPELKQQFARNLQACVQAETRPSEDSVAALANNLATALPGKKLSTQDQAKLAQDLANVLNSASVQPAEIQAALVSARQILLSSGVSEADTQVILKDLQAVVGEVQKAATARK
jgi:hypothetical protein